MKLAIRIALLTVIGFGIGFAAVTFLVGKPSNDLGFDPDAERIQLDWGILRGLNLETGEKTPELEEADGRLVEIPGFMVPLEDEAQEITEFLLVPSPQACIHVPAPPPNQMVHVKMAPGNKTPVQFGPIWLVGKMQITDYNGPYGKSSFFVTGVSTRPYN